MALSVINCKAFLKKLSRISLQSDDGKPGAIAKYAIASLRAKEIYQYSELLIPGTSNELALQQ